MVGTVTLTEPWTAADLADRLGPIPLHRICMDPPPGTAVEQDAVDLHDREDRLFELVDGVLVEKTVGAYESYVGLRVGRLVGNFVEQEGLGVVLGADGMLRLAPGLIRIPDVSFISFARLPGGRIPREPVASLVPDLAVEIISKTNTAEEMERKLRDYFEAGVGLVWYIYPIRRQAEVYTGPNQFVVVDEDENLDGGRVLPGLRLPLRQVLAEPGHAPSS